jgi:hypothetical protein
VGFSCFGPALLSEPTHDLWRGALHRGQPHPGPDGANVEDTDRSHDRYGRNSGRSRRGIAVWPGTCVGAISWIIAHAALLFAALLIFLALRLKRLKKRVDKLALLRSKE